MTRVTNYQNSSEVSRSWLVTRATDSHNSSEVSLSWLVIQATNNQNSSEVSRPWLVPRVTSESQRSHMSGDLRKVSQFWLVTPDQPYELTTASPNGYGSIACAYREHQIETSNSTVSESDTVELLLSI